MKLNLKQTKNNYSNQKGITLIALVVTIVVLLILAGVSVNAIFGDSGIIERAKEAQNKMNQATQNDLDAISGLSNWIDSKTNGTIGGEDNTRVKISTLVGKSAVTKNTKAEDAYGNKITIPKGFKVLAHSENTTTGDVTYTYSGNTIPAVQDGIVIEHGTDGNQFVWVPIGTIKNKDNTTNTITLGRYNNFTATDGVYKPVQKAEDYDQETLMIAKYKEETATIKKVAASTSQQTEYKELKESRISTSETENTSARDLTTFISTAIENGGYYIARYEAGITGTTHNSKLATKTATDGSVKPQSKKGLGVWDGITQPNAATIAKAMYGEIKENNELVYASDLVNSYAWDTAIIFIQTYSTKADASSYASKTKSTSFTNTGASNDKYCNIWDMTENAYEWTTEHSMSATTSSGDMGPYITHVWFVSDTGTTNRSASSRYATNSNSGDAQYGLRTILYVK